MYSPTVASWLDFGDGGHGLTLNPVVKPASGAPVVTEALKRCLPGCWGRPQLRVLRRWFSGCRWGLGGTVSPPAGASPQPPGLWLHPGPWGIPCLGAPHPSYLVFWASRGSVGVPPPWRVPVGDGLELLPSCGHRFGASGENRAVQASKVFACGGRAAGVLSHCRRRRAGRGPSTACLPGGAPSSGLAPPRACGGGSPALPVGPVRGFGGGCLKGLQASPLSSKQSGGGSVPHRRVLFRSEVLQFGSFCVHAMSA